ncbi:MBL fold metallo-hydrolase [Catenulispora pinisilvae]|uniref:MBL fold metallo-hydrolase n=1 Tax=Catenulispora pinisilvae TaxID=2705253 RepID=UPI001892526D|nr:MBL fold metallo-hydrolase [Catenulispora pinisilvae]
MQDAAPGTTRPPGEELPGVWSIRVPFPDNPLGYTLVYALETTAGGPVLIDAGWDDPGSLAALEQGLEAIGTSISDVHGVLVTHHHPDHHGLAGRIRELSGCWVALHEADAKVVDLVRTAEREPWTKRYKALLELCGAPADAIANAAAAIPSGAKPAVPDVLIEDGALMDVPGRTLRAVWTPGHSPGHTCFHLEDSGALLTGDHVLPGITPVVTVYDDHVVGTSDPLGDFLASLQKVSRLKTTRALPAHRAPFDDVAGRAAEITEHHVRRLAQIEGQLAVGPKTLWSITEGMEWNKGWERLDTFARHLALGEAGSHLRHLALTGRVRLSSTEPIEFSLA